MDGNDKTKYVGRWHGGQEPGLVENNVWIHSMGLNYSSKIEVQFKLQIQFKNVILFVTD